MTERRLGIGIGLVLGVAAVILFVFVFSDETIDEPAVDEPAVEAPTNGSPARDRGEERPEADDPTRDAEPNPGAPSEPPFPTIEVVDGQPVGGVQQIETDKGEEIAFVIRSDVADHVHVHGYDLFEDVEAGGRARFSFEASIDGIFEIELEDRGVQIAELRVNP